MKDTQIRRKGEMWDTGEEQREGKAQGTQEERSSGDRGAWEERERDAGE